MSRKYFILIGLLLIVILIAAIQVNHNNYYRGVYDMCVRSYSINNQVTEFDLLSCKNIELQARNERWYTMAMPHPVEGQ